MGVLRALYTSSPQQILDAARQRVFRRGDLPPKSALVDEGFLRSEEYRELMSRFLPFPGVHDAHEAQNETRSFLFRHHAQRSKLGGFRWRGIQENLDTVLGLLGDPRRRSVDFGGAACPIGLNSEVVDLMPTDALGRQVAFHALADVPGSIDTVFTSHALEHVPELDQILAQIAAHLSPGGALIAHVPAFTCERWRAGQHTSSRYNDHVWTFGLAGSTVPSGLHRYAEIDGMIAKHLAVEQASYCGDDSIFVVAKKA